MLLLGLFVFTISLEELPMEGFVYVGRGGSSANVIGLKDGDLILSWRTLDVEPPAEGKVLHFCEYFRVSLDYSEQGQLELKGLRGGKPFSVTMHPQDWPIDVRPVLKREWVIMHEGALDLCEKDLKRSLEVWQPLLKIFENHENPYFGFWLWSVIGDKQMKAQEWNSAEMSFQKMSEFANRSRNWYSVTRALDIFSLFYQRKQEFSKAKELSLKSLKIRQENYPNSLSVSKSFFLLGRQDYYMGHMEESREYFQKALDIRLKLAPMSMGLADCYINMGNIFGDLGDLNKSDYMYQSAWAVLQVIQPEGIKASNIYQNRGINAMLRSDFHRALEFYQHSLEIKKKIQ